jgi:hypothetical protein
MADDLWDAFSKADNIWASGPDFTDLPELPEPADKRQPLDWVVFIRASQEKAISQLWTTNYPEPGTGRTVGEGDWSRWIMAIKAAEVHRDKAMQHLGWIQQWRLQQNAETAAAQAGEALGRRPTGQETLVLLDQARQADPDMYSPRDQEDMHTYRERLKVILKAETDKRCNGLVQARYTGNKPVAEFRASRSDEPPVPGRAALVGITTEAFRDMHLAVMEGVDRWPPSARVFYR